MRPVRRRRRDAPLPNSERDWATSLTSDTDSPQDLMVRRRSPREDLVDHGQNPSPRQPGNLTRRAPVQANPLCGAVSTSAAAGEADTPDSRSPDQFAPHTAITVSTPAFSHWLYPTTFGRSTTAIPVIPVCLYPHLSSPSTQYGFPFGTKSGAPRLTWTPSLAPERIIIVS